LSIQTSKETANLVLRIHATLEENLYKIVISYGDDSGDLNGVLSKCWWGVMNYIS